MERAQVYSLIDEERLYQDSKWIRPKHNHSPTEYLVFIQHQVNKAIATASEQDGDIGAMEFIRNLTALGVAAMEEHGAPNRKVFPCDVGAEG